VSPRFTESEKDKGAKDMSLCAAQTPLH